MKLNDKGMTLVEIIVSIALISIVLIFLLNLFINVQANYRFSKLQANYDVLVSDVIKIVSDDIIEYKLEKVDLSEDKKSVKLYFHSYRKSDLSKKIVKEIKIENNSDGIPIISYQFENDGTRLTSEENIKTFIRKLPEDIDISDININVEYMAEATEDSNYVKIKIPLSDSYDNNYDINIYGKLVNS